MLFTYSDLSPIAAAAIAKILSNKALTERIALQGHFPVEHPDEGSRRSAQGSNSEDKARRLTYVRKRFTYVRVKSKRRLIKNQLRSSLSLKRKRLNFPEIRDPCSSKAIRSSVHSSSS